MTIPPETRRAINESQVRQYFAAWDPHWRWVLILGLRDMRANLDRLGQLAAQAAENDSWQTDEYVYGPLALGITAAAVNEATTHSEDLFALLKFLRDPVTFVQQMASYGAGRVVQSAGELAQDTDERLSRRFCIPSLQTLESGLTKAIDPESAIENVHHGMAVLGSLVRKVVDFYHTYEFFHFQYKHGLKILFRPFGGPPPAETLARRKEDVLAPLFALSNEAVARVVQRPPAQQALMFALDPVAQPHIEELIQSRNLLRIQTAGTEVDLDTVVAHAWRVSRLLRIASANRLALGHLDDHGQQAFQLPGSGDSDVVNVLIEPERAVELSDVIG